MKIHSKGGAYCKRVLNSKGVQDGMPLSLAVKVSRVAPEEKRTTVPYKVAYFNGQIKIALL